MFVIANFILGLARVLDILLNLYMWLMIIRALLSWVNPDPRSPLVRFLNNATEPLLYRIRRSLPVIYGGLDLSPLVVLLIIYFLQIFLVGSLRDIAVTLHW